MCRLYHYILPLFLLFIGQKLSGQDYTLSATTLETSNAIEADIKAYHKDEDGFMWMASNNGIVRFDGHQFKIFSTANSNLRSHFSDRGGDLVEDQEGYIWIPGDNTTDLLHRSTFEIIPFEEKFPDRPFRANIERLIQTPNGTIIFRLFKEPGVFKYHKETGFEEFSLQKNISNTYSFQRDSIWFYYPEHRFRKYDLATGKLLKELSGNVSGVSHCILPDLNEDIFKKLEGNKISFYSVQNENLELLASYTSDVRFLASWNLLFYLPDEDVFLALFPDRNFYILNLRQQSIIPLERPANLSRKRIARGVTDDRGLIWMSNRRQIQLLKLQKNNFRQYQPFESTRGIWLNEDYLFAAKQKVSLNISEINDNQTLNYSYNTVDTKNKNELWIGGGAGILQLDPNTLTTIEKVPKPDERIGFRSILQDRQGGWWAGVTYDGIYHKSISDEKIHPYEKYNGFEKIFGAIHFLEDGDYIWVASYSGLYRIHKTKGVVAHYSEASDKEFHLPFENVLFIHKDSQHNYWVASSGGGVVKLQLDSNFHIIHSKHFTVQDGLPANTIYCIVEDDKKRLWMSTYNGIVCLDMKTEAIQTFSKSDGISELEFNRNSYNKGQDGRIYFGSLRGTTCFHPDSVIRNSNLNQPTAITRFSVYKKEQNEWVDKTMQTLNDKKINLQPSDLFFKLGISMLEYFDAENIRYSYKIEGLLEDFQTIQGNTLEISGLPYGQYQLTIRGQGTDGRYSDRELVLPLIVERPFYLKWWFIASALFVISITIIQLYYWRIQRLNQRQKELELIVQGRTAQVEKDKKVIETQAKQLKELDEVKSRFFANISHELRTPLTLILNPLARVLHRNELTNKDFTTLTLMQQNGQKLLKRINELLDLSRLDANKLEINQTPVFLYPLLRNIIASVDSAANAKDIQLLFEYHLNEDLQILMDIDKTEKILLNYLSNALKFTPKNGVITVRTERVQQLLQVSVSDTGTGILPEEIEKIFDRFYQSPRSKGQQGSGIGLALCRELAKVLDGKIWAESTVGQGSTFYVQLPLIESFAVKEKPSVLNHETDSEAIIIPAFDSTKNATVLVVEDNPDLRNYLTEVLQQFYNVQTAEHGQMALEWLNETNRKIPDIIISDIMMPVMDGIELLISIKNNDRFRHIPMIMLTARQNVDVKLEALRIGVDDYLTKPFNEIELITRVANLIDNTKNRITTDLSLTPGKEKTASPQLSKAELKWLEKVEAIIVENIADPQFILKNIAPMVNLSYNGFQQKIKKITGLSPKKYERSIKLNKAREILKGGEVETVSEVLYQLGFDNHFHFSKIYKQAFGIMPSEELK